MAKQTILKERSTGEVMYPHTHASLVHTADGGNVEDAIDAAKYKVFIDMWNARCVVSSATDSNTIKRNTFGRYNADTGYFELNGLTDITYKEAIEIMRIPDVAASKENNTTLSYSFARTLFPIMIGYGSIEDVCSCMKKLEVVRFVDYYIVNNGTDPDTHPIQLNDTHACFNQAHNLVEVKGILKLIGNDFVNTHFYNSFIGCAKLATLWVQGIHLNTNLNTLKSLRLDCIAYMIEHAANTTPITITLHPEAYARVTDDIIAAATAKQITIAST